MLKEPRAGRVKTRLGREIGMTRAAWWFRHQSARLIRRLSDPRWHILLAISPDTARTSRAFPRHLPRRAQGKGDLGARMARLFRRLPPGPVVIIGADIPAITPADIAEAFRALGGHDATFGPAPDGGYWLVGLKRTRGTPISLFKGVRWSSEHALDDSIAGLSGLSFSLIGELADVDTQDDLARLSR